LAIVGGTIAWSSAGACRSDDSGFWARHRWSASRAC
jgi:hypothetical protein